METELFNQLIALGPSGVMIAGVVYIVKFFNSQLDKRDEQLKDINATLVKLIENNTAALTRLTAVVETRRE
jgi:hypothetical protein